MGYDYEYMRPYAMPEDAFMALGGLLAVVLVLYLLILAFGIVSYVLQSLGMYTIAKRRGIHHPWLAWLPVGNMWLLGSISDQYQYVVKGRVRSRRKALLGLTIAMYALMIPTYIGYFAMLVTGLSEDPSASGILVPAIITILFGLALVVVAIIAVVFQYMATYDMFVSCDPNNAVLYLVLSIFFTVTLPFFTFASRKKDLGMPPRRAPQPAAPVAPAPAAPAAPVAPPVPPIAPPVADDPEEAPEAAEAEPAEEPTEDP